LGQVRTGKGGFSHDAAVRLVHSSFDEWQLARLAAADMSDRSEPARGLAQDMLELQVY
jgi:hypothetical protein